MTKPEDGSWDDATQHDDNAQMDGDDQPTMRANDEHVAALRKERMKQRLIDDAASNKRGVRTTAQGLQQGTRTPASGVQTTPPVSTIPQDAPTPPAGLVALQHRDPLLDGTPVSRTVTDRGIPVQPDPSSTNKGIPVAPRAPASSEPPASSSSPDIASALYAAAGETPIAKGRLQTQDGVVLLDRVSGNSPTGEAPRRSESASGGVVIVATGMDADRIRRLCHQQSLLVPIVGSLAIAHEALAVIVIGEPSPPAPARVAHVVRPSVSDAQLVAIMRALVTGRVVAEPPTVSDENEPRAVEAAQRIATLDDRGAIEMIAVEAITALTGADRAHCLFFDPASGAFWSEGTRRTLGDSRRAIAGLVGWAAYTGQAIHAEPAGDDPRYLLEIDDPEGKPQSRIMVQPIIGGDRRTHAVLVAARRWRHDPFKPSEVGRLAKFAALVAPTLDLVASGPDGRKPRTTIPGPLKNAQTAALIDPPRTKPPTGPSPLTAPRPRPPSAPGAPGTKRPPTSPPHRGSASGIDAPTAPRPIVDDGDASDSKRLRATREPPSTSNTGRTKVPTGETRRPAPTPIAPSPAAPRTKAPSDETRPELKPGSEVPPGFSQQPGSLPAYDSSSGMSFPDGSHLPGDSPGPTASTRPGGPRTRGPTNETRPEGPGSAASRPPTGPNPIHPSGQRPSRPPTGPNPTERPTTGPNPVAARPSTPPVRPSAPLVEKLPLPAPRHPPSTPPVPASSIAMAHSVAVVAADDEHNRALRIAKTCGLDIALASITDDAPANARVITLGLPWSPDLDPRVVYVARTSISNDHLADLMTAIATGKALASVEPPGKPNNPTEARRAQIAFAGSRTFAGALDFVTAEASAITTLKKLLDADRAYFLLYDDATGALSSPGRKKSLGDNRRSIAGMAGWSALTGRPSQAERGAADPRWLGPIDDPDGDSNSQLLVQPVIRTDQRVQAIIVAARRPRRPGFTDVDLALAERFASLVAPLLEQLHEHVESTKLVDGATPSTALATRPQMSPLQRLIARIKALFGR
ncbi:MAG TPA: GAF domain-containing protein [Kofleriaceae bacterium]|nr:GAF domain-containing protein [Kofleriaceae bacterium]